MADAVIDAAVVVGKLRCLCSLWDGGATPVGRGGRFRSASIENGF